MTFIGDMFSSDKGAGFEAKEANILNPATAEQANQGYNQTQQNLQQQQAFLNALQTQGGIGNQSNVFNQMQGTAGMLQQLAEGKGPSPAEAMLRQAADQAIKQQAGTVSSTKGLNPAIAAQIAAQQGAQMQQGAANAAAQMRANQQLGAIGALQSQQANLANLATQQVGQQAGALNNTTQATQNANQQVLNQINAQNQANVGMQGNMNQANAGIAQGNAQGQRDFGYGLINQGIQGAMMMSDAANKTNINSADSKLKHMLDRVHMADGGPVSVSVAPSLGSASLSFLAGDSSSNPPPVVSGSPVNSAPTSPAAESGNALGSSIMQTLAPSIISQLGAGGASAAGAGGAGGAAASSMMPAAAAAMSDEKVKKDIKSADKKTEDMLAKAGAHEYEYKNSAKDLPGAGSGKHISPMAQELEKSELGKEMVIDTPQGKMVDYGKGLGTMMAAMSMLHKRISELEGSKKSKKMSNGGDVDMKSGGHVPGKAKVNGDSLKNDTVPAMLSPGEIVIPRSVVNSKDPVKASAKFVEAILSRQNIKK